MKQETYCLIIAVCSIAVTVAIIVKMMPRRFYRRSTWREGVDRRLEILDEDVFTLNGQVGRIEEYLRESDYRDYQKQEG